MALKDVLAILESTPAKLRLELAGLGAKQLRARPAPGKWSIQEILAHLADVEQLMRGRVEAIRTQDMPHFESFNQDQRAIDRRYDRIDPWDSLASLIRQRRANLRWLKKLRPAELRRKGVHEQVGEVSAGDFLYEWAFHDLGHLRQIMEVKRYWLYPYMGNTQKFYQFGQ
jgi:hypothetical protein